MFIFILGHKGPTPAGSSSCDFREATGLRVGKSTDASRGATSPTVVKKRLFLTKLAKIGAKPRQLGFVGILGKGYNPAGSTIPTSVQTDRFCS